MKLVHSFKFRLMASYILLIMTPVIVLGAFAFNSSVRSAKDNARHNVQGTIRQMKDNIVYKLDDIERVSNHLFTDQELQRWLISREQGWDMYDNFTFRLKPSLYKLLQYTPLHVQLRLYVNNDNLPEVYATVPPGTDPLALQKRYELYHLSRLVSEPDIPDWSGQNLTDSGSEVVWKQIGADRQFGNLSMIRPLYYFPEFEFIGVLAMTVKASDIFQSLDYVNIGAQAAVVVLDDEGETLYWSGGEQANMNDMRELSDPSDYLVLEEPLEGMGWRLIAYIPKEILEKEAQAVRSAAIIICLISFAVLLVVSLIISRYFSNRVNKVVSSMRAFREGEFQKRIKFKGNDEFRQMGEAFNDMAQHIDELIRKVYLTNLEKRDAELTSLQAQINPHFLYNTLSSINRLANFGELDKLNQMVMGLAKFYRLSLNEGKTMISIDRELQQAQSYTDIQTIKYADAADIMYEIDPEALRYCTVKLILQPFLENIFEHAWNGDQITIHISVQKQENTIVFCISDGGLGMNEDTIEQIFNRNGLKLGYGIRNVDDRIKLQFGEPYGVSIASVLNEGTTVTITIPLVEP
ncbi:sensor histidine kinase [Paenibacillaceae bacterium]|nr:sensor histidine kinase [Paenibacillaceae bacterium]